jgi:hypothetical protein
LDADPAMAEAWRWTVEAGRFTVSSEDAVVTLAPEDTTLRDLSAVTCTCLLAPACLHIAAVLMRLEVDTGSPVESSLEGGLNLEGGPASPVEPMASAATTPPEIATDAMRAAASGLSAAIARVLEVGASSAGVVARGEILRAVHSCQVVGLHRAASAGLRVAQGLARLQDDEPDFRLLDLRNDIAESLRTARRVMRGEASREVVGTARRAYEPAGALRLFGVFTEPIIARSGYAGCVTFLVDRDLRVWALSDVVPADAERALEAYAGGAAIGDVALSHRTVGRTGLHIGDARVSRDGRLGRGQQVRAVGAAGVRWEEPPIDDLFKVPLADQLARIWHSRTEAEPERRQGDAFLFATATIIGIRGGRLVIAIGGTEFACVPPLDQAELAYLDNYTVLAEASGAVLRVVAKPRPDEPRTIELVAIGEVAGGGLSLPPRWEGRANLGFDRLTRAHAERREPVATGSTARAAPDVLDPLTRRLERMVIGGRMTLAETARRGVLQDVALLRRRHLRTGAAVLANLAEVASARTDSAVLADRWLAAITYERAASRRVAGARWMSG